MDMNSKTRRPGDTWQPTWKVLDSGLRWAPQQAALGAGPRPNHRLSLTHAESPAASLPTENLLETLSASFWERFLRKRAGDGHRSPYVCCHPDTRPPRGRFCSCPHPWQVTRHSWAARAALVVGVSCSDLLPRPPWELPLPCALDLHVPEPGACASLLSLPEALTSSPTGHPFVPATTSPGSPR